MEINLEQIDAMINNFDENEKKILKVKTIEMKFIKNLVKERQKRGLSQSELAYRTGLTQQVISSFEKCDRKPTLPNLIKYLNGLGIDINDLFEK